MKTVSKHRNAYGYVCVCEVAGEGGGHAVKRTRLFQEYTGTYFYMYMYVGLRGEEKRFKRFTRHTKTLDKVTGR